MAGRTEYCWEMVSFLFICLYIKSKVVPLQQAQQVKYIFKNLFQAYNEASSNVLT